MGDSFIYFSPSFECLCYILIKIESITSQELAHPHNTTSHATLSLVTHNLFIHIFFYFYFYFDPFLSSTESHSNRIKQTLFLLYIFCISIQRFLSLLEFQVLLRTPNSVDSYIKLFRSVSIERTKKGTLFIFSLLLL